MPIINVKVSMKEDEGLAKSIAKEITDLTCKILKKKPEVTAITIQFVDPKYWFVGNVSLAECGQNSFYLDIKVTDGTNLKNEKMAYIEGIFAMLGKYLPNLHTESYVYVEEVKGDAYGFGGKTQEFRFVDGLKK